MILFLQLLCEQRKGNSERAKRNGEIERKELESKIDTILRRYRSVVSDDRMQRLDRSLLVSRIARTRLQRDSHVSLKRWLVSILSLRGVITCGTRLDPIRGKRCCARIYNYIIIKLRQC